MKKGNEKRNSEPLIKRNYFITEFIPFDDTMSNQTSESSSKYRVSDNQFLKNKTYFTKSLFREDELDESTSLDNDSYYMISKLKKKCHSSKLEIKNGSSLSTKNRFNYESSLFGNKTKCFKGTPLISY